MIDLRKEQQAYNHRKGALQRNVRLDALGVPIEMRMTFEEWLKVWVDSGKLPLRGSGRGKYCMSRVNDMGHYEVGNVFIQLSVENTRQGHLGRKRSQQTIDRINKSLEGKRQGQNNGFYGKKHSAETLAKLSIAHSGPQTPLQMAARQKEGRKIKTCPHCGLTGNGPAMQRWHFSYCRHA